MQKGRDKAPTGKREGRGRGKGIHGNRQPVVNSRESYAFSRVPVKTTSSTTSFLSSGEEDVSLLRSRRAAFPHTSSRVRRKRLRDLNPDARITDARTGAREEIRHPRGLIPSRDPRRSIDSSFRG